jgi:hypothetical protein
VKQLPNVPVGTVDSPSERRDEVNEKGGSGDGITYFRLTIVGGNRLARPIRKISR